MGRSGPPLSSAGDRRLALTRKDLTSGKEGTKKDRYRITLDQRLVRALGHPVRVQALAILNERIASPKEISRELGQSVGHVSYHINVLKECDCVELVDTAQRRGAMEHYYRATDSAFLDDSEWATLPASIRPGLSAGVLQTIVDDAAAAMTSGTFAKRTDVHLSWTPMILDEDGWGELRDELMATLEKVLEIQSVSAERLAKEDASGIPVSVAMMSFEASISNDRKVAPPKKRP
jgi:DNA-binding transcriptional ArsR family regulator